MSVGKKSKSGAASEVNLVRRKKPTPWTVQEHRLFLYGVKKFGKGHWKSIARYTVLTKTRVQIASHAQKYFLHLNNVKEKKRRRTSIYDITLENDLDLQQVKQHNPEHTIQPLHEVHQAREIIGLQNDNSVPHSRVQHNPMEQICEQICEKQQPPQLATFEDNFALYHIDQHSLSPSKMQQLTHHIDPQNLLPSKTQQLTHHIDDYDLAPLPDIPEFSPNYINLENLQDLETQLWVPPLYLQSQQFPHFIDHYGWAPSPNQSKLFDN